MRVCKKPLLCSQKILLNMFGMKMLFLSSLLLAGLFITSCSSSEDPQSSGESLVSLKVQTDAGFQSRIVDESGYSDLNNYTVQLLKDGEVQTNWIWNYAEIPSSIKVSAGNYQLKAFYGEDSPASTQSMYVEGVSEILNVTGTEEDVQTLSVVCKPVCAKVIVTFAKDMDTYFSDYSVTIKTQALGEESFVWRKNDTDPVYLKVNDNESVSMDINLVKISDGTSSTINKVYDLSPKQAMTLNLAPVVTQDEGQLGITIEIDEKTNDHEMDITVPGDWK